ncbi:cyclic nucleotide-binding domain-containing protein [Pantanalinema sp. GBBB05]|uniref:cyclic nucleotide-binding domain-containing protein n=1 Tax=Pantanalinema sp. GBBB05 TaxID=2604139 RepID=UPI001DA4D3AD|nr:cyclic nucleotide-binding domain-containing protein [Pantanalinema sp. GBBB05]
MLQPAEVVAIFQSSPEIQTFAAGEVIFTQGEPGEDMYGILEGEIEQYINGQLIETLKTGDIFGVGALIQPDRLRVTKAIAKTNCKLASMNQRHFLFAIQETPTFALEVLRSYYDRLRALKVFSD